MSTSTAPVPPRLPRYNGPDLQLKMFLDQLAYQVELALADLIVPLASYSVSNYTPTRSLNGATAGAPQAVAVLATLIADLQRKGTLG